MKFLLTVSIFVFANTLSSQTKQILFLGNSYTGYNDLPKLIYDVSASAGDTFQYDCNVLGGANLLFHATDSESKSKITAKKWDHVVIQAQSLAPSLAFVDFRDRILPNAQIISNLYYNKNECGRPVFYMTWGRKKGDAINCPNRPWVCTYESMDSVIQKNYRIMANENEGHIAPVGAVWRKIIEDYPEIELYDGDNSHPSQRGSYAAAVTFYSTFFRKDPSKITYNYVLSEKEADQIKVAVKEIVFDTLNQWNIGKYDPIASFEYQLNQDSLIIDNNSRNSSQYRWWSNGQMISIDVNPRLEIDSNVQIITLIASQCNISDTAVVNIIGLTSTQRNEQQEVKIFPNPASEKLYTEFTYDFIAMKIYSLNGQWMGSYVNQKEIDISHFSKGTYIIRINNQSGEYHYQKFLKS